jgi:hypothetical protein
MVSRAPGSVNEVRVAGGSGSRRPDSLTRASHDASTLAGSKGDITLALRGTTGPLDSPVHIARGSWKVVAGTGAYANLKGRGTFTAVTDQVTGALTAINTGKARGAEG